ncbi:MAG: hypothetical protein IJ721_10335 [Bacteroidales bacterium]|nr:hypothetical protein [Bacteroidales bacterium]
MPYRLTRNEVVSKDGVAKRFFRACHQEMNSVFFLALYSDRKISGRHLHITESLQGRLVVTDVIMVPVRESCHNAIAPIEAIHRKAHVEAVLLSERQEFGQDEQKVVVWAEFQVGSMRRGLQSSKSQWN